MNRHLPFRHLARPLLCLPILLLAGCMSGYLGHRGHDAADIVTLTLGAGSGAKLRLGPVQVAAFENTDLVGIRAG